MPFNQNFHTDYYKEKTHLNIYIFYRNTKGDTGLLGHSI